MAISTIRLQSLQSDSNLHNQTAVSTIQQQSLQSDCNLHNRTATSTIRLQCRRIAVWLWRLHMDCWDCSLIAEIAVWFWKSVKIGGPKIEASHWLRAQNRGLWLVERTGFKKFKALAFCLEISLIPLIPYGNLHNQTAISAIRLQSLQSDCNLSNQTAILLHCSLIVEIAIRNEWNERDFWTKG